MERFAHVPSCSVAVYAHPDDADVAAGGTIATWSRAGCQTHLVIICDGAKGTHGTEPSKEHLRSRRTGELEFAADILGVSSITSLGYPDGEFANDLDLQSRLVGIVRSLRPESVLAPDPTAVFFGGVYVNHRDHRETGWAVLDAVAPASAMPLYFPNAGPAHSVRDLLLSGTHEPDVTVDITGAFEAKVTAVLAHQSQLSEDTESLRAIIESRARQSGHDIGVNFGESFRHVALGH